MNSQPDAVADRSDAESEYEFRLLNPMRRPAVILAFCVAKLMLCGGCSGDGAGSPTATVTGRVTIGGQPLGESAVVAFLGQDGSPATALTDADGRYELTVLGSKSIPTGHYKIGLSPYDPNESTASAPVDPKQVLDFQTGAPVHSMQWNSHVPAKYGNPATSGLERDVKEGPNVIDIEIAK